ncbi:MAG: FMN-binding negative transcriptional regulator [Rhodopirellula sp.]|nr:FMN-binding negative transcriptional regulator [Rhodopirellula sp.]
MYTPSSFVVDNLATLHSRIEENSFATLITTNGDRPAASHLPLLLDRDAGPNGTLIGHMAKANPQWREIANTDALAIFHGPHAYISPGWFAEQNVVPTWNYVAVHATGTVKLVEEPAALLNIVRRYVQVYESTMPKPWQLDSAEPDFIESLLGAIIGFTIEIESIEGKWKLNQNHSEERRQRVIAGLRTQLGENPSGIAELMQATLTPGI